MSNSIDSKLEHQIHELASVYGRPAVQAIIETWKKDSVTVEDVEQLKALLKHPDEY